MYSKDLRSALTYSRDLQGGEGDVEQGGKVLLYHVQVRCLRGLGEGGDEGGWLEEEECPVARQVVAVSWKEGVDSNNTRDAVLGIKLFS